MPNEEKEIAACSYEPLPTCIFFRTPKNWNNHEESTFYHGWVYMGSFTWCSCLFWSFGCSLWCVAALLRGVHNAEVLQAGHALFALFCWEIHQGFTIPKISEMLLKWIKSKPSFTWTCLMMPQNPLRLDTWKNNTPTFVTRQNNNICPRGLMYVEATRSFVE